MKVNVWKIPVYVYYLFDKEVLATYLKVDVPVGKTPKKEAVITKKEVVTIDMRGGCPPPSFSFLYFNALNFNTLKWLRRVSSMKCL